MYCSLALPDTSRSGSKFIKNVMKRRIGVRVVYVIKEKGWLLAHLDSFNWDFQNFGSIDFCLPNKRVKMRYVGFANHSGNPVVMLVATDASEMSLEEIAQIINNGGIASEVYLELNDS